MINSRQKGAAGEREWRDVLRAEGYTAKRGQQFAGSPDSPDVICPELGGHVHFEVKRVENLNIHQAVNQATSDAGSKMPVVAHRRNRGPWLITMHAPDWFKLVREALPVVTKPDYECCETCHSPNPGCTMPVEQCAMKQGLI